MIFGFSRRKKANRRIVEAVYETLGSASRHPTLYTDMDVPDTVMGRFEMIAAHMALFLRRTENAGAAVKDLAQEMVDAFFEDLDHSMREIGIGDMGVPKRMKKLARMFYGRHESYRKAIDDGDLAGLAEALARNVHPGAETPPSGMERLAAQMMAVAAALDATGDDALLAGRLVLPQPGVLASAAQQGPEEGARP